MRAYCTVVPAPSRISTNKHIFLSLAEAVQSSKPGVMTTPPSALEPRRTDTGRVRTPNNGETHSAPAGGK